MAVNDLVRQRLRMLQLQRRVTQEAIGQAAGHDQAWVSAWLKGSYAIGLEELDGIARSLGVPITFFFETFADAAEEKLLTRYRALDPKLRAAVDGIVEGLAPDPLPRRPHGRKRNDA